MNVGNRSYDRATALGAAKGVFWKKGYHAASLKDLEAAMDMKPGSIYAAFSSKETLFHLSLEQYYYDDCREMFEFLNRPGSSLSAFAEYLREISKFERHAPNSLCMLVKALSNEPSPHTPNAKAAQYYLDKILSEFENVFNKAQTMGEIDAKLDTHKLAMRYQSCIGALKFELHSGTPREKITALAEDMANLFEALRID